MTTSFHEAAMTGHLDPLREATKRDCNKPDETGMTPTLWAAYEGKVDALRLIVSRGGDPNKADYLGHTALHFAALSGHRAVIEYLVAFGCNLWALNNEYRSAMQLAAENGKREIVDLLDDVAGRQAVTNKKVVQKAKEKAVKEADERIKKYRKMVREIEKNQRKWEKQQSVGVTAEKNGFPVYQGAGMEDGADSATPIPGRLWLPNRNSMLSSLPKENDAAEVDDALDSFNQIHGEDGETSPTSDGKGSPRTSTSGYPSNRASVSSVPRGDQEMWNEAAEGLEDEVDASTSAMEIFLTVNGLEDYIPVFYEEDIDMKALELLNEQDILDLRLPLGPRRKLSLAIAERKQTIASPGQVVDSAL